MEVGRDAVFWQSPRTRKQARPIVATPTARAAGIEPLEIIVDTREQYAYRFSTHQVVLQRRALPCGDYGVTVSERLVAVVERRSRTDLVSSLLNGKLRYLLGELAALPRSAVVVEDRYSQIFKLSWVRPALVPAGSPDCKSAGPPFRSRSARPGNSPRSGSTATSRPPTPGPTPNTLSPSASAPTSAVQKSRPLSQHPSHPPPKSVPGPAPPGWMFPTADASTQTYGKHCAPRTVSDRSSRYVHG